MWISKKKFQQLEKRVADLEEQVQSQHTKIEAKKFAEGLSKAIRQQLIKSADEATCDTQQED